MRQVWRGRWESCTGVGRSSIALPKPCLACSWLPSKPESSPADLWGGPPGRRGSPWTRSLLHPLRLLHQFHPPVMRPPLVAIVTGYRANGPAPCGAPPGSRDSAVKPTAVPDPAFPPPSHLGAQGRHHRLQVFVGGPEAPLVLLGEIVLIVGRVVELVLVFDVHGARVPGFRQDGEEALPIHRALPGNAKAPPPGIIQRIDAGAAQHMP